MNSNEKAVKNLTLNIKDAANNSYRVTYYDTWTGDFSEESEIEARNGQLFLKDIPLPAGRDLAIWLKPVE